MTLSNRKSPPTALNPKPFQMPPWQLLKGKGGTSRHRDPQGFNIEVPDVYSWRPAGWPALSLARARECGQPDAEIVARNRPKPRRRATTDVPTGGVV